MGDRTSKKVSMNGPKRKVLNTEALKLKTAKQAFGEFINTLSVLQSKIQKKFADLSCKL